MPPRVCSGTFTSNCRSIGTRGSSNSPMSVSPDPAAAKPLQRAPTKRLASTSIVDGRLQASFNAGRPHAPQRRSKLSCRPFARVLHLYAPTEANSSDRGISDECYQPHLPNKRRIALPGLFRYRFARCARPKPMPPICLCNTSRSAEPVLYCRAGSRPDEQQFAELAEGGVENLYVRNDDFCNLSNDVLASLESLLKREDIRRTEKFAALQIAVAVTVEQTLRLVDCSKFHALADESRR